MYLQLNLARMKVVIPIAKGVRRIRLTSSRESLSGVGAPYHHMYLQCNLARMKVVAPVVKRERRIRAGSRESPSGVGAPSHHMYLQRNLQV